MCHELTYEGSVLEFTNFTAKVDQVIIVNIVEFNARFLDFYCLKEKSMLVQQSF